MADPLEFAFGTPPTAAGAAAAATNLTPFQALLSPPLPSFLAPLPFLFRILALSIALPFLLLTLVDASGYVIFRTLGHRPTHIRVKRPPEQSITFNAESPQVSIRPTAVSKDARLLYPGTYDASRLLRGRKRWGEPPTDPEDDDGYGLLPPSESVTPTPRDSPVNTPGPSVLGLPSMTVSSSSSSSSSLRLRSTTALGQRVPKLAFPGPSSAGAGACEPRPSSPPPSPSSTYSAAGLHRARVPSIGFEGPMVALSEGEESGYESNGAGTGFADPSSSLPTSAESSPTTSVHGLPVLTGAGADAGAATVVSKRKGKAKAKTRAGMAFTPVEEKTSSPPSPSLAVTVHAIEDRPQAGDKVEGSATERDSGGESVELSRRERRAGGIPTSSDTPILVALPSETSSSASPSPSPPPSLSSPTSPVPCPSPRHGASTSVAGAASQTETAEEGAYRSGKHTGTDTGADADAGGPWTPSTPAAVTGAEESPSSSHSSGGSGGKSPTDGLSRSLTGSWVDVDAEDGERIGEDERSEGASGRVGEEKSSDGRGRQAHERPGSGSCDGLPPPALGLGLDLDEAGNASQAVQRQRQQLQHQRSFTREVVA